MPARQARAPAGPVTDDMPSPELQAVIDDVRRVAPALESHVRGTEYPLTVDEAARAMDEAGLALGEGTSLGAYRYDPDTIEFELCIEHGSGAFATYDTAPMSTRDVGESGGCPDL